MDMKWDYYHLKSNSLELEAIAFDLKGPFQIKNLRTALAAISKLKENIFDIQFKQ